MLRVKLAPDLHLFVCANVRDEDAPLGHGCRERGALVYDALKAEVAKRGAYRSIWVTKTHCLGICPDKGCAVVSYPDGTVYRGVDAGDVGELLSALPAAGAP